MERFYFEGFNRGKRDHRVKMKPDQSAFILKAVYRLILCDEERRKQIKNKIIEQLECIK